MPTWIQPPTSMLVNVCILLSASLGVIYLLACLYALINADRMIFPAPPPSYTDDETILKLTTERGEKISALYLPAAEGAPLLLFSHGNGEDVGEIRPLMEEFRRQGVSVFAYDYPGYGTSSGTPNESNCYEAIDASYAYATEKLGYESDSIVLYGRSLGSGPSTWLAAKEQVAGLILDGAFTSTFRVMTRIRLLPWDVFDNLAKLPKINAPTLLVHGKEDRVVPFSHALKNAEARGEEVEVFWAEGAGHNDLIETAGAEYWSRVLSFIRTNTQHE